MTDDAAIRQLRKLGYQAGQYDHTTNRILVLTANGERWCTLEAIYRGPEAIKKQLGPPPHTTLTWPTLNRGKHQP